VKRNDKSTAAMSDVNRIRLTALDGTAANLLFLTAGLFLVGGVLVQIGYGGHSDTAGNTGVGVFLVGLLVSVAANRAMRRTRPDSSRQDKRATIVIMVIAVLLALVSATLAFGVGTPVVGIALLLFAAAWLLLAVSDRVTVTRKAHP